MPFSRAGQLARFVPTARVTDSLDLVAENLRSAPHGVLPVLDRPTFGEGDASERAARILGLIDSRDLSRVSAMIGEPVAAHSNGSGAFSSGAFAATGANSNGTAALTAPVEAPTFHGEPKTFANLTARDVMNADVPHIPAIFSLHNALSTLDRYDFSALPVIDDRGRYCGVLSRADILAALGNNVRPPMVGGMATPLGVWLTNGSLTGGAPPLGLFLSGLALAGCLFASQIVLALVFWMINPAWGAAAFSGNLGMALDNTQTLNVLAFMGHKLLFLLALRALPMAGVHAAEHQTVWALERGLPLEIEYVEKMPRAHPRCGTNLLAIGGLMTIGFTHFPLAALGPEWVIVVLAATFFGWRAFGTLIQEWFTTRPASKKQLQSGIDAARELIEKYQAQPFAAPSRPLRLLNNGMFFSMLGMFVGVSVLFWLLNWIAVQVVR